MRNLAADTMYLWHVHEGSCAATGALVPGWTYRTQVGTNGTLTANAAGNANHARQVGDVQRRSRQELLRERARRDADQRPARRHDHRVRRPEGRQGRRQEQVEGATRPEGQGPKKPKEGRTRTPGALMRAPGVDLASRTAECHKDGCSAPAAPIAASPHEVVWR